MEIKDWIDSGMDYAAGVELYNKIGSNANYKRLFSLRKTKYSEALLQRQLKDILNASPTIEPETKPEDFTRETKKQYRQIDVSKLPEELKKLNIRKGQLYKEAAHCHAKMDLLTTDADRLVYAKIIVGNFEQMDAIWEQLDYFVDNGQTMKPEKKEFDIESANPVDLIRQRNNVRAHISKLKNKPLKAELLKQKQEQLAKIEAKIKSL